jgi:hypothetical protein
MAILFKQTKRTKKRNEDEFSSVFTGDADMITEQEVLSVIQYCKQHFGPDALAFALSSKKGGTWGYVVVKTEFTGLRVQRGKLKDDTGGVFSTELRLTLRFSDATEAMQFALAFPVKR